MTFKEFFTFSTWWGKLLGAFFGYLTSGPVGALFGIFVGNFFDRGLHSHFTNPHWTYHSEKRKAAQKIFFESTFSVMGHIAKSDGRVSEQEIGMAKLLMKEMGLNKEQQEQAKNFFNEGKKASFRLDDILSELQRVCRDNIELLKLFLDIQYRAAKVDGLTPYKIKALNDVLSHLGIAPLQQQYRFYEDFGQQAYTQHQYSRHQHRAYSSSSQKQYNTKSSKPFDRLTHAYALLEVDSKANKQEVKKAYRRLLSKNHPDKLIAQGLPEAMIKMANEKTHNIMKAYELICQAKGWS